METCTGQTLTIEAIFLIAGVLVFPIFALGQDSPEVVLDPSEAPRRSVIMERNQVVREIRATDRVSLREGQYVATRTGAEVKYRRIESDIRGTLPFKLEITSRSGERLELAPVFEFATSGLNLDSAQDVFRGELLLGVVDSTNEAATKTLGSPIAMQIVPGAHGKAAPRDVVITHTNVPFVPVSVSTTSTEPLTVKVLMSFDPDGSEIQMPIHRPALGVDISPEQIQGLGIESARITVSVVDHTPLPGRAVVLNTNKGSLGATKLNLDIAGTASTTITSIGTGSAKITASSTLLESGEAQVVFMLPLMFFLIVLAGSIVGSGVSVLVGTKSLSSRRKLVAFLIGLCVGFGLTSMVHAGFDMPEYFLLPDNVVGEAAAFATAFVTSAIGGAVIKRWVRSLEGRNGGQPAKT